MAQVPGDRRKAILQALAEQLARPQTERITTAALAAHLEVSEAALYRHFASKAQMFEGLIDFIEQTLFTLITRLALDESAHQREVESVVSLLLGFAQKNPGMTRVLTGEALVTEDARLLERLWQLQERLEAALEVAIEREAARRSLPVADPAARANVIFCHVLGRWHQYARSGFKKQPMADWAHQWQALSRLL